MLDRESV